LRLGRGIQGGSQELVYTLFESLAGSTHVLPELGPDVLIERYRGAHIMMLAERHRDSKRAELRSCKLGWPGLAIAARHPTSLW
jgi:hypothetical protein